MISKRPHTRAQLSEVEKQEAKLSVDVMKEALNTSVYQPITEIPSDLAARQLDASLLPASASTSDSVVILDVRPPDEVAERPLKLEGYDIQAMPFYRLHSGFQNLDQQKEYWLYCEKGVMSQLQARNLLDDGFQNVRVCPEEVLR